MARRALQVEIARAGVASLAALAACGFDSPEASTGGAPPEAGAPDARAFDPAADCPGGYTISLPSTAATSRYRVIATLAQFWPHNAACNADRPGFTHAAALNDMQELLELEAHVDPSPLDRYYLGGVQDPQATATNQGWIWFDGSSVLQTAWYPGPGDVEPDDANQGTEAHNQQVLILDSFEVYLQDAAGVTGYGIVCECDGTPVSPRAQAFIDADPINPN